ncbi:MAG: 4-hydroxy-tetrahydrodipicolinate reductase [Pseudomonadota bacterium]
MTETLKIAVAGAAGRMGQQLIAAALDADHKLAGGSEAPGSVHIGKDLAQMIGREPVGVSIQAGITEVAKDADVWIDFTRPQTTLTALALAPNSGVKAFVIGTTGFNQQQEAEIAQAAERVAIIKAGNFSLGVNLLEALVKQAASKLGPDWDIEILETHHRRKVDAPSGTALMLGEAAALGRTADLETLRANPYDGPDVEREAGQIGFSVRRTGGVIGEHEVTFGTDMEVLTLAHTALDRAVFAHGAIKAAEWVARQGPGLYSMDDVLGLT